MGKKWKMHLVEKEIRLDENGNTSRQILKTP